MATIDNLNFKVIIDDAQFNKKIQEMEKMAKNFNTSISNLLNVQAVSQELVVSNRKRNQMETDNVRAVERQNREKMRTAALQDQLNAKLERATKSYQSQSRILNELKGYALGYLSIHGAGQLLSSLVRVTGEFELQKTTLAAMLGDLNKAEQVITKIQGLAVESPFQFKELTTYAKQLSAFSVPAEELYDTTKMLADVSAGLGVGMDRIVLAYGQVRSAAFLRGQEVRQFTEAGIPILDELAKQFTELEGRAVSTGEVFEKISKRMVPFEMVAKIFKDMTSEGGKFFNMQEVQAETLRGKISNLKDAYEVMLNEIGKGQSENLKGAVDWARQLMQNYEQTGRTLVELIATYGIYKTTLLAIEGVTQSFVLTNHKLIASLVSAGKYLLTNPYVAFTAAVTGVAYALYKQHTALEGYQKIQKEVASVQSKHIKETAKETAKLDALYAKLKLAKKGTEEYNEARKEIYTQFSGYISELRAEGKEVSDLAGIYDALRLKIEDATKARTSAKAQQRLSETYDQEIDEYYDKYINIITNAQKTLNRRSKKGYAEFTEFEKAGFWKFLTGSMHMGDLENTPGLERVVRILNDATIDASADLKILRRQIVATTNQYNKSLKEIKKAYGDVQDSTIEGGGIPPLGGGDDYDPTKAIQAEVDAVRRLKDAYDTLAPYMNGEMLRKTLTALFPNADQSLIQSLDFRAKLVELAGQLNQFDKEAGAKLLDSISGEKASEIAASFKAVEQYKKMLDSWLGEDFSITGEGVSFDISKIIHNLNNEYAKIDEKREKALDLLNKAQMDDEVALAKVREVLGEESWQKYLVNGSKTIDELAAREKRAAKQTADEKIRDLASKDLKERMDKANVNLTDFDDKTVNQIKEQIARLKKLRTELYDERNKIYEGGVTTEEIPLLERLDAELKQLGIVIADTGEELDKSIFDKMSKGAEAIGEMGDSITSLGEAMDSSGIADFGRELTKAGETFAGIADALKADDTVALVANIVSYAISSITDVITAAYERQQALNEAAREYAEIMNDVRRESYSGIFGTDELGLASENSKIMKEAQTAYQNALEAAQKVGLKGLKQGSAGIEFKKTSVMAMLESISQNGGWELYTKDGEVNIKALETYFDSFSKGLTKKQRRLVEDLIAQGNALDDAALQQAEYLTSLFDSVADNIATGMVDAFIESGDAAIDMGNIISDVSKQMVADLIKSIYLMPILEGYQKSFEALQNDTSLTPTERTEKQLNLLDSALQQIAGQSDDITETIAKFEEYLGADTEGTKDLGEGIKGITEDQANLLASYLNAIRADVSYSKALWARMDANLQRIADIFTSSPTLMEYQAQIAANTFNTAQATQDILAELRSVITLDGSDTAIRIYNS